MRISTAQFQKASIGNVLEQQAKLTKLQEQLSSGRRILTPADDPAGAAQALQLSGKISNLERLQQNANLAEHRLVQEESVLDQIGNLLGRVHDLTLDANNATKSAADRRLIATELRERYAELVQLANAQDGNGEYLFAGTSSRDAPFSVSGNRQVTYHGDQTERFVQVGPTRQLPVNHTGFDVFMRIPQGNGSFVTAADAGNTGSGVIDIGRVAGPAAPDGDQYQLSFVTNGDGELGYVVKNLTTGVDEPADEADAPAFRAGEPIVFGGMSVTITGTPEPGDSFTATPAAPKSMFSTLDELISALETAEDTAASRARVNNVANSTLTNLKHGSENILRVRAEVGSRLHAIDSEVAGNEDSKLALKTALSRIEDLDYAQAISDFNLQLVGLQAAQESYVRVQSLSLFNFL
jgi:flagellar hook-associated protein 3 FlgL